MIPVVRRLKKQMHAPDAARNGGPAVCTLSRTGKLSVKLRTEWAPEVEGVVQQAVAMTPYGNDDWRASVAWRVC